jgi:hypothetical protein
MKAFISCEGFFNDQSYLVLQNKAIEYYKPAWAKPQLCIFQSTNKHIRQKNRCYPVKDRP